MYISKLWNIFVGVVEMYLLKMLPAPVDLLKITSGEWQRSKMSNKHLIGVCQIYLVCAPFCQICKFRCCIQLQNWKIGGSQLHLVNCCTCRCQTWKGEKSPKYTNRTLLIDALERKIHQIPKLLLHLTTSKGERKICKTNMKTKTETNIERRRKKHKPRHVNCKRYKMIFMK